MAKIERVLQTKSLITHTMLMISRIGFTSVGQSYWQLGFENRAENPKLNHQFVETIMPYVKTLIIVLLPIGLLLDLLTWRWRHFGNLIIYYELLSLLIQGFVPFDFGNFEMLLILQ